MLKVGRKNSPQNSYQWRPDFRDVESLPELRAVRTKFFIPALAITAVVIFSSYLLYQEYRASKISEDIAKVSSEISTYEVRHDEKVKLNGEFMKISQVLNEVVEFKEGRLIGSDFLLAVSSRLLEGLYLTRVEYVAGKAVISGNAQVPAEEASLLVNEYLQSLEKGDALQGMLVSYKLTSLEREKVGKNVSFRIEVTKGEEKK